MQMCGVFTALGPENFSHLVRGISIGDREGEDVVAVCESFLEERIAGHEMSRRSRVT